MKKLFTFLKRLWQKPLARLITSLLILAALFTQLPLAELWRTLRQLSPGLWLMALAIFLAGHVGGVFKWTLLINLKQGKFPVAMAFRYYFAGLFANLFLPSIAGGDVVRAGLAIRYRSRQKEAIVLGSVLDRFLDLLALGILVLAGAFFSPLALAADDRLVLVALLVVFAGLAGAALLLLVLPLPPRLPPRLTTLIERVRGLIKHLLTHPQRALVGLALAVFIQGVFVALNAYLGRAIGLDLPLAVWFLAWPLAKLSATLPISLGGLGVREAALAVFLGRFGVPLAGAVGLGLLWQTVLVAGGAFGGLFYFIANRQTGDLTAGVTPQSELSS